MGQVMVIMLRHKVQMVDQSHRRLQPWMEDDAGRNCRIDFLSAAHQLQARVSKVGQNLADRALVVLGFVRFPIA